MHRRFILAFAVLAACGDNHNGNTPPTVGDLNLTTDEDVPITRTLDASDPDGSTVSITLGTPANGTVTLSGNAFTYTPNANFHGSDSFTVTVSDGTLETAGTVSIQVASINDAPTGVADSFATNEDQAHEAEVSALLANDTDVDGDTISLTAVGNATNGTVAMAAGDITFTPTNNFVGTGSYRYTISDGTLTTDVTVTINVGGVNDAPVATDDAQSTPEDVDLVVTGATLVGNDTDPDGQTLSVSSVSGATNGTVALASGTVTFTPTANFNGTATFDYEVSDGALMDTGTVTITVSPVNDPPIAVDDAASTSQETAVVIAATDLTSNDTDIDAGDTLTVTSVQNPMNGTVSLASGNVTFTPATGFTGTASFEYTVTDSGSATDTGRVDVTVTACTPVDDSIACTMDVCQGGVPVHIPNNLSCENDGFACTVPTCSTTTGCSETPTDTICDDGASCSSEVCNPTGGGANGAGCVVTLDNTACNDSLTCTTDVCAPGTGNPTTGCTNTSTCNDNVACTDDTCGAGGCVFTPNNANCPSGDVCFAASGCRTPLASVAITELGILGSEMIELLNTGAAGALDGVTLQNMAGTIVTIRPVADPTGALGLSLDLAAGAYAWGVPNPANAGDIPAGATFVYGDPGTTFSFADTGDLVTVTAQDSTLLDMVDFTMLATNPDALVLADQFPAVAGRTTQVDVGSQTSAANDDGDNWCTTFRAANTAGVANQSCTALVINEVYYDHDNPAGGTDDGFPFVELAGPGGATISGWALQGINGVTGVTQEPNVTFAAGTRLPSNGFFVVADLAGGVTQVPNADLVVATDMQNGTTANPGHAVRLSDASATPVIIDMICYGAATLGTCEGTPNADFDPDRVGASLARNLTSADTNNNTVDFTLDPSPSPGVANAPVVAQITSINPNDGLATGGTVVTITGRDFADVANGAIADNDVSATFVDVATPDTTSQSDSCLITAVDFVTGVQTITCTAPARAAGPIVGDFILTNPASIGGQSAVVTNGWTYTGVLNETNAAAEADFCNLQFPLVMTPTAGQPTVPVFGQIFEAGLTDAPGQAPGIVAEVGYGPTATNPTTAGSWLWFATTFNVEVGNNDEYSGTFIAPAAGTYGYAYRFSFDNGLNWTYCDTDGAGSNAGLDFSAAAVGVMTVTP